MFFFQNINFYLIIFFSHHKWFRVDLPDYLFPSEAGLEALPNTDPDVHFMPSVTPQELLRLAHTTKATVQEAAMQLVKNPAYMSQLFV